MEGLYINKNGELCEAIDHNDFIAEYKINGITEHPIFGIYFSFNSKNKSWKD